MSTNETTTDRDHIGDLYIALAQAQSIAWFLSGYHARHEMDPEHMRNLGFLLERVLGDADRAGRAAGVSTLDDLYSALDQSGSIAWMASDIRGDYVMPSEQIRNLGFLLERLLTDAKKAVDTAIDAMHAARTTPPAAAATA